MSAIQIIFNGLSINLIKLEAANKPCDLSPVGIQLQLSQASKDSNIRSTIWMTEETGPRKRAEYH